MKKVLIVIARTPVQEDSANWLVLRDAVQKGLGATAKADITSLDYLLFDIGKTSQIKDTRTGADVADYDLVIIRNVGKNAEPGITLAHYLAMKGIPFTDSYLDTQGSGKLASAMLRRRHNLPVPRTIYGPATVLPDYVEEISLAYPFIVKADRGKKGRDNYLVKDREELQELLQRYKTEGNKELIVQEFIPNDGDYRALVTGNKIGVVIKRTAEGAHTHLNNTSQGGSATLEPVNLFSDEVQNVILESAKLEQLQVAGVDVIFNKNTGEPFILEVNRAPQLGNGAFAEEKMAAYAAMIKTLLEKGEKQ